MTDITKIDINRINDIDTLVDSKADQTIEGQKTYTTSVNKELNIDYTTTDKNQEDILLKGVVDGSLKNEIFAGRYNTTDSFRMRVIKDKWSDIAININDNKDAYANVSCHGDLNNLSLNAVSNSTNSTVIPTIGWVNDPSKSTNVVHRTGDETINGSKTFNNNVKLVGGGERIFYTQNTNIDSSLTEFENTNTNGGVRVLDKNGKIISDLRNVTTTAGEVRTEIIARRFLNDANKEGIIGVRVDKKGDAYAYTTCKGYTSNATTDTQLASSGWVNDPTKSTNVVHRTGDETISGSKTFSSTIQGTALRAQWADLAEVYASDNNYPKGTLVKFGGEKEITIADDVVNAVISSEPGLVLNSKNDGQMIALTGRVPVRVIGKINKFDRIGLSNINGVGCKTDGKAFAIALEQKDYEEEGLILCVVKLDF